LGFQSKTKDSAVPPEREKKDKEGYTQIDLGQIMDILPITDIHSLSDNDTLIVLFLVLFLSFSIFCV
jgi:hypothetical protein